MSVFKKHEGGSHYQSLKIQPAQYSIKNNLPWPEGEAIKYITRHKLKGGKKDLEKAKHCIDMIIERDYEEEVIDIHGEDSHAATENWSAMIAQMQDTGKKHRRKKK